MKGAQQPLQNSQED